MKISKEKAIDLTHYEKRSLIRFLTLYLSSVFVLLAIIGYLFFENNQTSMMNALKFEMMYQGRMLSSKIILEAMSLEENQNTNFNLNSFLKSLDLCRFEVGYYDLYGDPLYSKISSFENFGEQFSIHNNECYCVIEDESEHLNVRFIVLKESKMQHTLQVLRMKIISYLIFLFIVMGIVGYFLGRLFMQPIREQIEALDRFIVDTTHELNTPITAILMTVESLKNIEEKKLARLQASAKRLMLMYRSLTYRLEGKEEFDELHDIAQILKERIEYMQEMIELKRLEVILKIDPLFFNITQSTTERLIDNLLSNAIKYSNRGDTITITTQKRELTIQDTGIGMSDEEQRDIFKRYKRANKERGGFGIGLSIVLLICQKYHIKINIHSKKGEGSKFTLHFPN